MSEERKKSLAVVDMIAVLLVCLAAVEGEVRGEKIGE
jgi:hypothetical protein